MIKRSLVLAILSVLTSVSMVMAQDVCPDVVGEALTTTNAVCSGIGRNEACYGNINITATLADDSLIFQSQGDIVEVTEIERLTLSPYVEDSQIWGVALMNVQANIPDTTPGQGVTFLLFGDVDIENAGDAMEAFYFSSGVGTAGCNEAQSGIIINTPEGVGTVSLIANDVTIDLGSTAVLTAQPDDVMTIALTEGNATVTADGESQTFEGGFQVTVPIDENLQAIGVPSEPEPIPEENTEDLPDVMEFVEEADDGTSEDSDASPEATEAVGGAVIGGNIVPQSGIWTSSPASITASAGCPPGMGAMIAPSIETTTIDFGNSFDLEQFISLVTAEGSLPGMVYTNPEPNVFEMSYSEEGASLTWTMTIQSDTEMTADFVMDMSGMGVSCVIDIDFTMQLSE